MIVNAQETQARRLEQVDEILAVLEHCSPAEEADYVREHVQNARTYLLGAMPAEFNESIELARQAMHLLEDSESLRAAQKILSELSAHPAR